MATNSQAGRNSYTLANLLRSRREASKAIASYDRARELDGDYAGRPYFHEERAGVLFLAGRYTEAVAEYEEAHRLGASVRTLALRADALMFAGDFASARAAFTDYNERAAGCGDAEWRLKQLFLDALVSDRQIPVPGS